MSDTPVIGFKEWANVNEALGTGASALILRKGGIHEGRGGFEFKHSGFFLFPTWFHTQNERLTWSPPQPERFQFPPEEQRTSVDIHYYAELQGLWRVTEWEKVAALAPLHVWQEDIVRERFIYDEDSCLNVALVRTYQLPQCWTFPYTKSYGGCRSWVQLPTAPYAVSAMRTAMSDADFSHIEAAVKSILG
jgi:hypothetical protein